MEVLAQLMEQGNALRFDTADHLLAYFQRHLHGNTAYQAFLSSPPNDDFRSI